MTVCGDLCFCPLRPQEIRPDRQGEGPISQPPPQPVVRRELPADVDSTTHSTLQTSRFWDWLRFHQMP